MIGIAQLMVVLDATIVNIALPSAQADLGFSDQDRQWVVTAYALAFGCLLLLGGRIGDLFGRKRAVRRRPDRLRRRLGDRRRRAELRDAGRRPRAPGRLRRAARPGRARAADHDLHRPGRARQGVRRLRRDRRRRRRGRPAARRHPHRVPHLALVACTSTSRFAIPAAIGALALLVRPASRDAAVRIDIPGALTATPRPVRARLRLRERRDPTAGATPSRSHASPPASCCSSPSSRSSAGSRNPLLPLRVVLDRNRGGSYIGDRGRRRRDVRRLPVPHLLPAADARLLAGRVGARVPADGRLRSSPRRPRSTAKLLPRTGPRPLVPHRDGARRAGDGVPDRPRRRLRPTPRHVLPGAAGHRASASG